MFVVDLRLPPDDLVSQMSAIRVWLDGHGFETSGFSYEEGSDCAVARLAFRVRLEAEAFAGQFAGRLAPGRRGRDGAAIIAAEPLLTTNAGQGPVL